MRDWIDHVTGCGSPVPHEPILPEPRLHGTVVKPWKRIRWPGGKSVVEIADRLGVNKNVLYARVKLGLSPRAAATIPRGGKLTIQCAWCGKRYAPGLYDEDGDPVCKTCFEAG